MSKYPIVGNGCVIDIMRVYSLDLHQNPDKKEQWAVSFIYDNKGPESEHGDIIFDGDYESMKKIYDEFKDKLVGVEYFEALDLIKEGRHEDD